MIDSKNTPVPKKFKILLIGDSCLDEYYIGTCDRLSPEAPVPVIKISEHTTSPGMAANVKKNLETLKQEIDFYTNDRTIKKTRYIDKRSGQHLLRVDDEPKLTPLNGNLIMFKIRKKYDAIVISDYNKGFVSYEHIERFIKEAKVPVFIDTKKVDLARFEGAIIKINLYEFNRLISTPKDLKGLIVTNGENGAMYNSKHYPAKKVDVSDVCGAGDTFLAFLVYGYLESNGNMDYAIELAIKAASESVKHRGNYAPKLDEVISHA